MSERLSVAHQLRDEAVAPEDWEYIIANSKAFCSSDSDSISIGLAAYLNIQKEPRYWEGISKELKDLPLSERLSVAHHVKMSEEEIVANVLYSQNTVRSQLEETSSKDEEKGKYGPILARYKEAGLIGQEVEVSAKEWDQIVVDVLPQLEAKSDLKLTPNQLYLLLDYLNVQKQPEYWDNLPPELAKLPLSTKLRVANLLKQVKERAIKSALSAHGAEAPQQNAILNELRGITEGSLSQFSVEKSLQHYKAKGLLNKTVTLEEWKGILDGIELLFSSKFKSKADAISTYLKIQNESGYWDDISKDLEKIPFEKRLWAANLLKEECEWVASVAISASFSVDAEEQIKAEHPVNPTSLKIKDEPKYWNHISLTITNPTGSTGPINLPLEIRVAANSFKTAYEKIVEVSLRNLSLKDFKSQYEAKPEPSLA